MKALNNCLLKLTWPLRANEDKQLMVASFDAWTKLLESVGIGLKAVAIPSAASGTYFSLQSLNGKYEVYVQDDETGLSWRIGWTSIQDLEKTLLEHGIAFIRKRGETAIETIVQNPWLGCRSLEELEIMKDLFDGRAAR